MKDALVSIDIAADDSVSRVWMVRFSCKSI